MPVRCLDVWSTPGVRDALQSLLRFLSDDQFEFAFSAAKETTSLDQYLDLGQGGDEMPDVDSVMLFSGGLDSLAGAVEQILSHSKKVALVSHRSVAKIDGRQRYLVDELRKRACRTARPVHVPVWVHLHNATALEFTQRSRSFLFAALATAVARIYDLDSCQFYENGVTSLNLPLCEQLTGARATRTTHPRVLREMSNLFSNLLDSPFRVESPFANDTKTDVVMRLKAAEHSDLIRSSVSCTRTRTTTPQKPHCGLCSQCIDRRFAVLAAGCEADDPGEGYVTDLFTGARESIQDKTMVERWVATADGCHTCQTAFEMMLQYPQLNDAIAFMGGSADANAERLFSLHKRHARQVTEVLDRMTGVHAGARRRNELPSTCLINFVNAEREVIGLLGDVVPDPVANGKLAKLAGIKDADAMSRVSRRALAAARCAVRSGGKGQLREWSHTQLHRAYPYLPAGKLKSFLEHTGFRNLSEPV